MFDDCGGIGLGFESIFDFIRTQTSLAVTRPNELKNATKSYDFKGICGVGFERRRCRSAIGKSKRSITWT